MSWTNSYKKSIDCSNPKGFSQKAHCRARKLRQMGKKTKSEPVREMNELEQQTAVFHQQLNPAAWDGMNLKPEVRQALLKVARSFMETWGVELEVTDIILTGSNANYNWTKFSDFDLHVVVRLGGYYDVRLVEKLLRAKKDEFNRRHNIRIKGYPVEVYAQGSNEHLVATGQYSLQSDSWLVEPRMSAPSFQHKEIGDMSDALIKEAQDAIATKNIDAIQLVLDKISGLRKSGLSKTGEFGLQNMVFKVVRNSGMIEKLRQALVDLSDKELSLDEDLRTWFRQKWVNIAKKKKSGGYEPCGTSGEKKGYAKCVPAAKAASMSKGEIKSAVRRKRAAQAAAGRPGKDQPGQGNKPIMVKTMKEETLQEKNTPTNPKLWARAKSLARSKFDVYPSAYANGWAAKWYRGKGGGWKSTNEAKGPCWDGYMQRGMKMKNGKMVPNCVPVSEELGKDNEWGRPELTQKMLAATPGQENADIPPAKIKSLKEFWMMCDTLEKYDNKLELASAQQPMEEEAPAWQRKEGKNPEGGLNRKGIASYRRANPGSKLSMAVTTKPSKLKKGSKAAKRRKSFCARMGGMKKRLTSAKTANDPDSRINKALRKWNC